MRFSIVDSHSMQIQPLNLWSLWVPLVLLGLVILMAVYLVRTSTQ